MATLHIRDVDAELVRELKIVAASNCLPLRTLIIHILRTEMNHATMPTRAKGDAAIRIWQQCEESAAGEYPEHDDSCECLMCKPRNEDSIKSKWIAAVTPYRKHAESCKCLMCKPPKEKP